MTITSHVSGTRGRFGLLRSPRSSLTRFGHTLSVVAIKAYIFGGETAAGKLAGSEMHAVTLERSGDPESDYAVIPAVAGDDAGPIPCARTRHAACGLHDSVLIFGGVDGDGKLLDETSSLWGFNTSTRTWNRPEVSNSGDCPARRSSARLFAYGSDVVLYGGCDDNGTELADVWLFSFPEKTWKPMPDAPISTTHAALSDGVLYLVSGSDKMSGNMHHLQLTVKPEETLKWDVVSFPTNPLTPGPLPREGAGLVAVSTGYGRKYLGYLFGARKSASILSTETAGKIDPERETRDPAPQYWSDMWTLQIPSAPPEMKVTTHLYDAIKPAKIKDNIRDAIGADAGTHQWAEVEVLPPADLEASEGKVHPGPRAHFAYDVMKDGRWIVIWGGVNAKGECEGDGWVVQLE